MKSLQGCPDILEMKGGDFAVIGKDSTEPAEKSPPSARLRTGVVNGDLACCAFENTPRQSQF
jgi:hypothetical protein